VILLVIAVAVLALRHISRVDLVLCAIAFTAAYALIAMAVVSQWLIWLPGILPLGAAWLLVLIAIATPDHHRARRPKATTIAPSVP
jgi:hypothetical protein